MFRAFIILTTLFFANAASASIYNYTPTGNAMIVQKGLEHKNFQHRLQAHVDVMKDDRKKFLRVTFSNGTNADYRLYLRLECVLNGQTESAVEFQVSKLGWSAHGSPERQRDFSVACHENAKLKYTWAHKQVGINFDEFLNLARSVVEFKISQQVVGALLGEQNVGALFRN